jgi:predicted Zn-ribbon and HTH transcriptional regulator
MARCHVYGAISNDVGQRQSVGGRRGSPRRISAWLNTDNEQGTDCSMEVSAEVTGQKNLNGKPRKTCSGCGHDFGDFYAERGQRCPRCNLERQGQDKRKTHFTVELPESKWGKDSCEVAIVAHGHRLRGLLEMGTILLGIKAADDLASGNTAHAKQCIDFSRETAQHLADSMRDVPANVKLPGGVDLRYALACVELVEALGEGVAKTEAS